MTRFGAAMLSVLVVGSCVACGSSNEQAPPKAVTSTSTAVEKSDWPESLRNFRFHWTADPGIDLDAGVAVPLRAYLESYDVASYTVDLGNVYPGFLRATPENDALDGDYLVQLAWVRPLNGLRTDEKGAEVFGYTPFHILRVDPTDSGLRAIVCEGTYANYVKSTSEPGMYVSVAADPQTAAPARPDDLVAVHRIELSETDTRSDADSPAVSTAQRGPAEAPGSDVFGKWFITGASSSYWGPIRGPQREDVATPELRQQCGERMPQPPDLRVEMATGFKAQPAPHGDSIPGWPVG